MALHYFDTSEQLRCQVHLACTQTIGGWRAGALILEKVAGAGGIDPALSEAAQEDSWHTATTLAATLTDRELLDDDVPPDRLLYRLFHTEGVAADRARALSFGCRCSRARLASILEGFPADDLDHMAVDDDIVMTCEFCNYDFRFPRQAVQGQASPANGQWVRRGLNQPRDLTTSMQAGLLSRRFVLLLPLVLAACGADEEPVYEPLRFNDLPPIQLNVASMEVQQRFIPSGMDARRQPPGSGAADRGAEGDGERPAAGIRHGEQGGVRHPRCLADPRQRRGERLVRRVADHPGR